MAGRPPVPTAIKLANGNPGKRPLNAAEPQPELGLGPAPADMTAAAKKVWRRYAKILESTKVGTQADAATFEAFCRHYALWQQLRKEGEANPIVSVHGQPMDNPALRRADRESKSWTAAAIQLGLTPAARTRIAAQQEEEQDDALALFARKRSTPPLKLAGGADG